MSFYRLSLRKKLMEENARSLSVVLKHCPRLQIFFFPLNLDLVTIQLVILQFSFFFQTGKLMETRIKGKNALRDDREMDGSGSPVIVKRK